MTPVGNKKSPVTREPMMLNAPLAVEIRPARMPATLRQDDITRADRRREVELEDPERWDGMS